MDLTSFGFEGSESKMKINMLRWAVNNIEPDQTAQMCRLNTIDFKSQINEPLDVQFISKLNRNESTHRINDIDIFIHSVRNN